MFLIVDAGFEGFRVLPFQQQRWLKQATDEAGGLEINARFFRAALERRGSVVAALRRCRRRLDRIEVNRLRQRPTPRSRRADARGRRGSCPIR